MNNWNVHFSPINLMYELYKRGLNENGERVIYRFDSVSIPYEEGTISSISASLRLNPEEAQQIMDGLWRSGVRPNNGEGSLAHIEGLKTHIEDLRKISFHTIGIKNV